MCSSVVERYPDKIEVEGPIPSTPTNIPMALFSKIDREILAILLVLLVMVLLTGFIIYQYMVWRYPSDQVKVRNLTGGAQTEMR